LNIQNQVVSMSRRMRIKWKVGTSQPRPKNSQVSPNYRL